MRIPGTGGRGHCVLMCVFMSVNVCWAAGRGRTAMYGRLLFNILVKEVVRDLESGSRAESLQYCTVRVPPVGPPQPHPPRRSPRFAPFLAMADARASNLAPDAMPPASNELDKDASNDAKRFKVDPVMSTSASLISLPSLTSTSPINEPGSRNEWAAKMAAAGGVVDLSNEGFLTPLRFGGIAHILSSPECCTTDLDLHHLSLGPVCSKLLAGAVASNSSLKRLNIERTGLGTICINSRCFVKNSIKSSFTKASCGLL